MIDWDKYDVKTVLEAKDEYGNRIIFSLVKDYQLTMGGDLCPNCKGFVEKFNNFKKIYKQMKTAKKSGFILKNMFNNIQLHFGSQVFVKNATITDEQGEYLLKNHKLGEKLFDAIPEKYLNAGAETTGKVKRVRKSKMTDIEENNIEENS
ncbi:MAG: hypothetical protein KDD49_03820 [Bacteroidetes bacterium]|nr:hypothetical protein [Bacteroidota bacterium]